MPTKTPRIMLLFLLMISFSPIQSPPERNDTSETGFKTISGERLLKKIERGEKMNLIDCRPENEYKTSHIPGAVNVSFDSFSFGRDSSVKAAMEKIRRDAGMNIHFILIDAETEEEYLPLSKLKELMKYLPQDRRKQIIFYCREPT